MSSTDIPTNPTLDAWITRLSEGHGAWGIPLSPHPADESHPATILYNKWLAFLNNYHSFLAAAVKSPQETWPGQDKRLLYNTISISPTNWAIIHETRPDWARGDIFQLELQLPRYLLDHGSIDQMFKQTAIHWCRADDIKDIDKRIKEQKVITPVCSIYPTGLTKMSPVRASDYILVRISAPELIVFLPNDITLRMLPPQPSSDKTSSSYYMDTSRLDDILGI